MVCSQPVSMNMKSRSLIAGKLFKLVDRAVSESEAGS